MRKYLPASNNFFPSILLAAAVSLLTACDQGTSENASVQLQITDAPSDFIQSADVWISRVYLKCGPKDENEDENGEDHFEGDDHRRADSLEVRRVKDDSLRARRNDDDEEDEGGDHCDRIDLFNDALQPFKVDLLSLRNGLVANLTVPTDVPPGTYDKLFVVVDSAFVTLKSPFKFSDGTTTTKLRIAGGKGHKAFKVDLAEPLDVTPGAATIMLVDFDVNESFVILGNPATNAGIKGVLFIPKLKEKHRDQREHSERGDHGEHGSSKND